MSDDPPRGVRHRTLRAECARRCLEAANRALEAQIHRLCSQCEDERRRRRDYQRRYRVLRRLLPRTCPDESDDDDNSSDGSSDGSDTAETPPTVTVARPPRLVPDYVRRLEDAVVQHVTREFLARDAQVQCAVDAAPTDDGLAFHVRVSFAEPPAAPPVASPRLQLLAAPPFAEPPQNPFDRVVSPRAGRLDDTVFPRSTDGGDAPDDRL